MPAVRSRARLNQRHIPGVRARARSLLGCSALRSSSACGNDGSSGIIAFHGMRANLPSLMAPPPLGTCYMAQLRVPVPPFNRLRFAVGATHNPPINRTRPGGSVSTSLHTSTPGRAGYRQRWASEGAPPCSCCFLPSLPAYFHIHSAVVKQSLYSQDPHLVRAGA